MPITKTTLEPMVQHQSAAANYIVGSYFRVDLGDAIALFSIPSFQPSVKLATPVIVRPL